MHQQLLVGNSFLELPIRFGIIEYYLALKVKGICNQACHFSDAHLFSIAENNWAGLVILPKYPDHQNRKVSVVDELSQRSPAAEHHKVTVVDFG